MGWVVGVEIGGGRRGPGNRGGRWRRDWLGLKRRRAGMGRRTLGTGEGSGSDLLLSKSDLQSDLQHARTGGQLPAITWHLSVESVGLTTEHTKCKRYLDRVQEVLSPVPFLHSWLAPTATATLTPPVGPLSSGP